MSEENILTEFTAFLNKSAMLAPAVAPQQENTTVALGQPASRQENVTAPATANAKAATTPGKSLSKAPF